MRLDVYLFEQKLAQSRNKAGEMIKNREVLVDGNVITKTSFSVDERANVDINLSGLYLFLTPFPWPDIG